MGQVICGLVITVMSGALGPCDARDYADFGGIAHDADGGWEQQFGDAALGGSRTALAAMTKR